MNISNKNVIIPVMAEIEPQLCKNVIKNVNKRLDWIYVVVQILVIGSFSYINAVSNTSFINKNKLKAKYNLEVEYVITFSLDIIQASVMV